VDQETADLRERLQGALGGAYALERELGGGGMSRVFVATETALDRAVVVKVLPPELAHAVSAERFRREIRLAARLQHPAIVPLLSAGDAGGLLYYTMPFVEGESLRQRLARGGELPIPDAVRVLREVARALAYAHTHGIVHRDVKPENILLGEDAVLVADFGVAKALAGALIHDGPEATDSQAVTTAGVALGTPAYMAPEQLVADPGTDHRADLYALGVVAYELLTGAHPFAGRTPQAVLAAHATEPPEPVLKRRPGLPPALGALVTRLLEKRPADRPQSADEVLRALEAAGAASGEAAAPIRRLGAVPRVRRSWTVVGALALLLAGAAYAAYGRRSGRPAQSHAAAMPPGRAAPDTAEGSKSVAVLPFVNLSADRENEYFSDGMTEELINALSRVEGLRVAARTSSFAFKGKNEAVGEIGRTLRVASVLEGSVRRAGDRLRVTAQLVDATSGYHLWSDEYDRQLKDVFAVQDEISRAIVVALRLKLRLGGRTDSALVSAPTADLAAHDLYLKGRFLWNQRTYESLLTAVRYFEQAIQRDSTYAEAYAGLADTYVVLPFWGPVRPVETYSKARAAARRALALDSTLAGAHAALAYAAMNGDYDWAGAEREFQKAITLNPNYATVHQWYADYLVIMGRPGEAIAENARARALDPLSRINGATAAVNLLYTGHPDDALREVRGTLELDPGFANAYETLCRVHLQRREPREAVAACERAAALSGRDQGLGALALAYAAAAESTKAAAVRRELEARARREYVAPTKLAQASLALGDTTAAVTWLERAADARDPWLIVDVLPDPLWDPLRADPRFARLRARLGLAP